MVHHFVRWELLQWCFNCMPNDLAVQQSLPRAFPQYYLRRMLNKLIATFKMLCWGIKHNTIGCEQSTPNYQSGRHYILRFPSHSWSLQHGDSSQVRADNYNRTHCYLPIYLLHQKTAKITGRKSEKRRPKIPMLFTNVGWKFIVPVS